MSAWLLAAVVGTVFLFAGVQKLTSWSTWRTDASGQGVPAHVATVVPFVEVALGVALIALRPNLVVLLSALLLLSAFTGHLVRLIRRGDLVPCSCFGSRHRRPPAWSDVWRNLALIACAVAALFL